MPFLHFLWYMNQRSLHAVTKVYYKSMTCFATVSPTKGLACHAKVSPTKGPSCTIWVRHFTKYVTKYEANPHSTEQDMLPIVFLISKKAIPYRTHGDTCCHGVSTPKIWSTAYSSTTSHDGINHLHHLNLCWNHNIDPHMVTSHLDGWKTTTPSPRHKPNSTSQRMED
jgi:hypothetical protein